MKNAELKLVKFNANDVIATSLKPYQIKFTNFANGIDCDATVEFYTGYKYTVSNSYSWEDMSPRFNAAYGTDALWATLPGASGNINATINGDRYESTTRQDDIDGIYKWNGTSFIAQ